MIRKSRHVLCTAFVGISALIIIAISINTSFAIEPKEVDKLLASDGAPIDQFGYSVAIDGDIAIIGAYGDDDLGSGSGSAYVFAWDGANWVEQAKLTASDGDGYDEFGHSVALDGGTVVIGAEGNWQSSGSTYVFTWDGTNWVEQAKLTASDGAAGDLFGYSVAIDGNTVIIGAFEDMHLGVSSGSAYVFLLLSNETPSGEDVVVLPPPVDEHGDPIEDAPDISLRFGDIEEGGETNVVITEPGPGTTSAPSGFRITGLKGRPLVFDIDTTATLAEGSTFELCINYSTFEIAGDPSNLTLSHEVDGHWVDMPSTNDTTNMILCGTADSFSYFAILEAGSTVISCLAPNGGISITGYPFTVLVEGQSEEFQVQPEGSITSLWSCGWEDGCRWLQYNLQAGSAWNIVTSDGGMLIMERAAQEPVPEFALQWGSFGSNPGEFNLPHGVEADQSGNVYVTERGNHRVQKFDAEGNFIQTFGSFGSGPEQFILPNEIAFDSLGDLYVTDEGNCRVQKLTSGGGFIQEWGSCGGGSGQFSLTWGIAIDSNDQVFVADTFNFRIQVFDNDGNYLREWGVQGVGDGEFEGPRGIAVDSKDNVIVVDEGNHRIQKFENDGTYLTQWGSFGNANGEFTWPHTVATDIVGNVFVGDVGNPRVQKFDKDGNFLVRWGNWDEFGGDQTGVDVSPNGLIYVVDFQRSGVLVYGTKAEIVIEPGTGGEVETTDGQLSITIPDDALSESETISVVQSLPEEPLVDVQIGESGGSGEVLAAYDLEPDGLVFDNPVTLTMTADVTALNQDQRDALDIYLFSDTNADGTPDTFVALGAVCYISDGPVFVATCTAEIVHFSTYGLIAPIDADQDGVADLFGDVEDQCSGTVIPESVPTKHLGINRWALVDADMVFDTKLRANEAPENLYSLADTAGCSCEQIIEALDLGSGQTKFGCSSSVMKEWVSSLSQ
ncbi:6-bladed beta-propeller [Pseudomonadota bacterium]